MAQRLGAVRTPLEVRALRHEAELEGHARLAVAAFQTDLSRAEAEAAALDSVALLRESPDRATIACRGIVDDGRVVAAYSMLLRRMRVGATYARTACIAGVVVDAAARGRGLGRALMEDAVREGRRRRAAIILLEGIPDFYKQFGFVDVWDPTRHLFGAEDARRLSPPPELEVRPAGPDDVDALTRLYRRHFGERHTGAFARARVAAAHRLRLAASARNTPRVAVDQRGRVRGYLMAGARNPALAREVVAEDAGALRALVSEHLQSLGPEPQGGKVELAWELPPDSVTFGLLADALPLRSETRRRQAEGWQARPGHPDAFRQMATEAVPSRSVRTPFALSIDGAATSVDPSCTEEPRATISGTVWLALAFGHRPLDWATLQPGQRLDARGREVLAAWLPAQTAWVAASDRF